MAQSREFLQSVLNSIEILTEYIQNNETDSESELETNDVVIDIPPPIHEPTPKKIFESARPYLRLMLICLATFGGILLVWNVMRPTTIIVTSPSASGPTSTTIILPAPNDSTNQTTNQTTNSFNSSQKIATAIKIITTSTSTTTTSTTTTEKPKIKDVDNIWNPL